MRNPNIHSRPATAKPVASVEGAVRGFSGGIHDLRIMPKPHQHQEVELNYLSEGSLTYLAGGQLVKIPAGRLAMFWAAVPHQVIQTREPGRFYWFTIPFAWFLQWKLPGPCVESLLQGRFMVDGQAQPGDERLLAQWSRDLKQGGAERQKIVQLEMEARLRRFLLAARFKKGSAARTGPSGGIPAVRKIAEIIALRYAEPLTVAEIAAPTGLHPNYAMTLFRKSCGMSILDYLIQHRIFHARRLLAATQDKVLDVAMQSGFGSLSRFNEAFLQASGCTPREYRRRFMS